MQVQPAPAAAPISGTASDANLKPKLMSWSSWKQQLATSPFVVPCSDKWFRMLWSSILLFHLLNAAGVARAVYSFIRTIIHPDVTSRTLRNFGVRFNVHVLYGAAVIGIAVTFLHCFHVGRAIMYSCVHRRFMFAADPPDQKKSDPSPSSRTSFLQIRRQVTQYLDGKARSRPLSIHVSRQLFWAPLKSIWWAVDHGLSACSIRGLYFDLGFYIRESIEIALQTYQAYHISCLVPQVWIVNLAVSVVVLNCWTTPLLHFCFHLNEPLRRVMCLATDIVLDFFSSMIIPFMIYGSYRSQMPEVDWYDPLWVMTAGNNLLCFHLNTWLDLAARTLPNFSMLSCLAAIQPLLRPHAATSIHKDPLTRASHSTSGQPPVNTSPLAFATKPLEPRGHIMSKAIHCCFMAYGLAVVIIYALAQHRTTQNPVPGCLLVTRPWLTTKYPCEVLELNCDQFQWLGSRDELNQVLSLTDEFTLTVLIVSHCPRLEIPETLRHFRYLVWLELYNSTLVSWEEDAALTASHMPHISRVFLLRVQLTEYPRGLLGDDDFNDFPTTLLDLVFVDTNVNALPHLLSDVIMASNPWMNMLIFERCGLVTLPLELADLQVDTLSLAGNMLTDFPAEFVAYHVYTELSLAHNPISQLADASVGGDTWHIKTIYLDYTDVAALPFPSDSIARRTISISASKTPICESKGVRPEVLNLVNCSSGGDPKGFLFPIAQHDVRWRIGTKI